MIFCFFLSKVTFFCLPFKIFLFTFRFQKAKYKVVFAVYLCLSCLWLMSFMNMKLNFFFFQIWKVYGCHFSFPLVFFHISKIQLHRCLCYLILFNWPLTKILFTLPLCSSDLSVSNDTKVHRPIIFWLPVY